MSTTSSSYSDWLISLAESTSSRSAWMVLDNPPSETPGDLPPPWWSPDKLSSGCCNCGGPVYTEVRHAEFPGNCEWCHKRMMHLFRRCQPPSPWTLPDRAEREWREDLLRYYKAVIEQRRAHGFQNKICTPNAEAGQQSPSSGNVKQVSRIRFDPQRAQELRELRSWRPEGTVLQPILSQSMEAVEATVRSLTIAQLEPILRAKGLCVAGAKDSMQERIINIINRHAQDGAVADFNHLVSLIIKARSRPTSVAFSVSDASVRQDPREVIASQLIERQGQPSDNIKGSQCGISYKTAKMIMSDWRKR